MKTAKTVLLGVSVTMDGVNDSRRVPGSWTARAIGFVHADAELLIAEHIDAIPKARIVLGIPPIDSLSDEFIERVAPAAPVAADNDHDLSTVGDRDGSCQIDFRVAIG